MSAEPTQRILIFEYLHVQSGMYADTAPSMRAEGRAMLLAMTRDLAALSDVAVSVAVCKSAAAEWPAISNVDVLIIEQDTDIVRAMLARGPFEAVFPIAPETDGLLLGLVSEFREQHQSVIAPSHDTIALGSDKFQLHEHLTAHKLPTVPTILASSGITTDICLEAVELLALSLDEEAVLKPRDGAGCEDIVRGRLAEMPAELKKCAAPEKMILQPFVAGELLSVGIIGRGPDRPPLILPVALQQIEWRDRKPVYRGGAIAANLPAETRLKLDELLQRLLLVVPVDRGYLGIDLLWNTEYFDDEWGIMELNPRLCTSYVGYREAISSNLAGEFMGRQTSETGLWKPDSTVFSCDFGDNTSYH